jgi:hypothetical protein
MATPPINANQANKVVVAFLDGRRVKGRVFNFSAIKETFDLFPPEEGNVPKSVTIRISDLKALFFVKDLIGHVGRHEPPAKDVPADILTHGRKIEVTFLDGERVLGTTDAYNPQKLGFFMFPADPKSNNLRVFVVNKNVKQARFV